jgi:hypothetical protein
MFDELERLRTDPHLHQLLDHYAALGAADRTVWHDRVMQRDGLGPRDLQHLHGELLAHGWIEQNTGVTDVLKPSVAAACYRVATAGLRALKAAAAEAVAG